MPVFLTRRVTFAAAHRYRRPDWSDERNLATFGACSREHYHGHSYSCDVTVSGEIDPATGMIIDLAVLDRALAAEVRDRFDHRNINLDVPEFADGQLVPTGEELARFICGKVQRSIGDAARVVSVVVAEDATLSAEYRPVRPGAFRVRDAGAGSFFLSPRERTVPADGAGRSSEEIPPLTSSIPVEHFLTESRALAEHLEPIVAARRVIAEQHATSIDLRRARGRIAVGRAAFDASVVLAAVGDLGSEFALLAAAFEEAGLAPASAIELARRHLPDATRLAVSWANAESEPRDPTRKLARTIAGAAGNAILAGAARRIARHAVARWKWPECPCCGASPDLALVDADARTLVCWRCDTTWPSVRQGCLGCGEQDALAIARVALPAMGYDLAICNSCGRYLKERNGRLTEDIFVERSRTQQVDEAARLRGLRA